MKSSLEPAEPGASLDISHHSSLSIRSGGAKCLCHLYLDRTLGNITIRILFKALHIHCQGSFIHSLIYFFYQERYIFNQFLVSHSNGFNLRVKRLDRDLISLLIEHLHSIHNTIYRIQMVSYICCFG